MSLPESCSSDAMDVESHASRNTTTVGSSSSYKESVGKTSSSEGISEPKLDENKSDMDNHGMDTGIAKSIHKDTSSVFGNEDSITDAGSSTAGNVVTHAKIASTLSTDSTDDSVPLTDSAPVTDADVCSDVPRSDSEQRQTGNDTKDNMDHDTEGADTGSDLSGFVVVKKEETACDFSDLAGKSDKEIVLPRLASKHEEDDTDEIKDEEEEEKKSSVSSLQQYRTQRRRPPVPNNVSDDTHDTGATDTDSDSSSDWMASSSSEMDDNHPRVRKKEVPTEPKLKPVDIVKTKGEFELSDLPPIEELKITVDENVVLHEVGSVDSVVGVLVVVKAKRDLPPLDSDTILFTHDKKPLGMIFETFGPVTAPFYSIRFNNPQEIQERGIEPGTEIFYAPEMEQYTHYVFTEQLRKMRGSDASWEHNNEPPPKFLDYSDDEEEQRANAKLRSKDEEEEDDDQQGNVGKKRKKRKARKKPLNGYVADISDSDGFQSADASGGSASMMHWPPTGGSQWRPPPRPAWSPWSSSPRNHPSYRHRPSQDHRNRFEGPRERFPGNWAPRPHWAREPPPPQMGMGRGPPRCMTPAFPPPGQGGFPPPCGPPHPDFMSCGPNSGPMPPPMDMRFVQNAHIGDGGAPVYGGPPGGNGPPGGGPPPHLRMPPPPPPQFGGAPRFQTGPQHHF